MKTLISYAMSFLGKPYIWGGEGPNGYDCSGLVQEILRSVGEDPKGDQTAQDLFNYFKTYADKPSPGALVFYGKGINHITHIAFVIDHFRVVEAGGGDHTCINMETASRENAMVRIRPYNHRKDIVGLKIPDYINIDRSDNV